MAKNSTKIIMTIFLFLLSLNSFSFTKLTTTAMRENSIRINALEIGEIDVTKITEPNMMIVLDAKTLNFDLDKWDIKDKYVANLEKLRDFILEHNFYVTIEGHTDSTGSEVYNLSLSLKRAESTKNKLIELGLPSDRIVSVVGRGEENPVATNETREGRVLNRRVELHLEKVRN